MALAEAPILMMLRKHTTLQNNRLTIKNISSMFHSKRILTFFYFVWPIKFSRFNLLVFKILSSTILLFVLIFSIGCLGKADSIDSEAGLNQNIVQNQIIVDCIPNERIKIDFNDDIIIEIKKWMYNYLEIKQEDNIAFNKKVEILIKFKNIQIFESKIIDIFEVRLSRHLPEAIPKNQILILDRLKKEVSLLPISKIHIIKLPNNDNLIAGVSWIRDKGYERIYQFNGICFLTLLDTSSEEFCGVGVPVARTKRDCMAYEPDTLNLTIKKDKNFIELNFSGKILTFCEELERGVETKDVSPKREQEIFLSFRGNFNNDTSITWVFVDSINYCPTIRKIFEY